MRNAETVELTIAVESLSRVQPLLAQGFTGFPRVPSQVVVVLKA